MIPENIFMFWREELSKLVDLKIMTNNILVITTITLVTFLVVCCQYQYNVIRVQYNVIRVLPHSGGDTLFTVITSDKRNEIVNKLETDIQQKLERWPAIFTSLCPSRLNKSTKKNERGLILAHRCIWESVVKSNYSKVVIFEDDACKSSETSVNIMNNCLKTMTTDVLFLGWCHHTDLYKMPLCTHAYALTKAACMMLLAEVDQCGPAIDIALQNTSLTWSLCERPDDEPTHWTQGCFHQCDSGGSLNV